MKRLIAILAVLILVGCYSEIDRMNRSIHESPKRQQASLDYARLYLQCMKDYGKANAKSSTTVSEIAIEASGNCNDAMETYRNQLHVYCVNSPDAVANYRVAENCGYQVQKNVDQLLADGKQETISQVIKNRKK